MTDDVQVAACLLVDSDVALWSVTTRKRLERQCRQIGVPLLDFAELPTTGRVMLIRGDYLFEERTLRALMEQDRAYLRCSVDKQLAAAIVPMADAHGASDRLIGGTGQARVDAEANDNAQASDEPTGPVLEPKDLVAFDHKLRKIQPPLLEPIHAADQDRLEALLFGGSYKGITDLVTKWFWPRPSKPVVRWCAAAGITPNTVTTIGFLLVLVASVAFLYGYYVTGLICGWIMTFLDTVDGKLARVTVQSSRFGHYLDHGTDILHPPFWYAFWGMSLVSLDPVLGFDITDLQWMLVVGYVGGRLIEAMFHMLGHCSIFSWRPFDAYFRLITGRRNPCLIILSGAILVGRPDWGFVGVAFWTGATTVVLLIRLIWGAVVRTRAGPLESWLADEAAPTRHPQAFRTFASTRAAYGSAYPGA